MAKKKPDLTADEQQEQDTFEANVAADEAAETPEPEPVPTPEPAPPDPPEAAKVEPYEHGGYVETGMDHERTVVIAGERWEHTSEAPDGRWVYSKS